MQQTYQQIQNKALLQDWDALLPDPVEDVDIWADKNRRLTERESPEAGPWRTKRVPYLREPMKCLSPSHRCQTVVLMFGAQLGKTETGNNWMGRSIDMAPGPMMSVQPTEGLAKRWSRQRLGPMITACDRLREKVAESKSRDSGNTVLSKEFPGGIKIITGANSAAGLRSMPVKFLNLDEIDAYPEDIDGEGDPCDLAEARTRNFARKKILKTSTPTFAGRSRIEAAHEEGDKREYYVPCPHCQEKQVLKFGQLQWDDDKPETVRYVCIECGAEIEEHHKTWMLEQGEWRAQDPEKSNGKVVSFHLSSLYSPIGWFSWEDIADRWLKAQGKPAKLRAFVNTVLAETWKERGSAPDWQRLYDRRESYEQNSIPDERVLFLTAGVDIQKDRIEVEIFGWAKTKESWSVDFRIIDNKEDGKRDWSELDKILTEKWTHPLGSEIGIAQLAVDASAFTQEVRAWARKHPFSKVMAIKGSDSAELIVGRPRDVDLKVDGKKTARALKEWTIGVSKAKEEIYGWLNQQKPTEESGDPYPEGYCHIPEYEAEYFKQLTAEQIVVRIVRGYRRYQWEKTRDRNEALDLRVYGRAAAARYGLDRFKQSKWKEIEDQLREKQAKKPKKKGEVERNGVKMRRGNFMKRD